MKPLDVVARDLVAPPLKAAGFRRRGRLFELDSPHGDRAFAELRQFRLGRHDAEFGIAVSVQPQVFFDWLNRDGDASRTRVGLWGLSLPAPGQSGVMRNHWSFDLDDESTGAELTRRVSQIVPGVLHLLDRANLVAYIRRTDTTRQEIFLRKDAALALLLSEDGPSDELDEVVGTLKTDSFFDELVHFVQRRAGTQPAACGGQNPPP
jgi:hypothetical protein